MLAAAWRALRLPLAALYWLPIGLCFTTHCYTLKLVTGRSMQPTLNPDSDQSRDVVVFDRYSIGTLRQYRRGDVVALWSPMHPQTLLVKRILALAGDTVQTLPPYPDAEVRVPEGHVWVEGDESFRSDDSNRFGPVPLALLDSRLTYVVWPPSRIGPLPTPTRPDPRTTRPYEPRWRQQMAEFERAQWRQSRVKEAAQNK